MIASGAMRDPKPMGMDSGRGEWPAFPAEW